MNIIKGQQNDVFWIISCETDGVVERYLNDMAEHLVEFLGKTGTSEPLILRIAERKNGEPETWSLYMTNRPFNQTSGTFQTDGDGKQLYLHSASQRYSAIFISDYSKNYSGSFSIELTNFISPQSKESRIIQKLEEWPEMFLQGVAGYYYYLTHCWYSRWITQYLDSLKIEYQMEADAYFTKDIFGLG